MLRPYIVLSPVRRGVEDGSAPLVARVLRVRQAPPGGRTGRGVRVRAALSGTLRRRSAARRQVPGCGARLDHVALPRMAAARGWRGAGDPGRGRDTAVADAAARRQA